jgi:uncharacterized protein (DUF885 family)
VGHVNDIADQYVDDWARLDPIGATFVGISGHDDAMSDLSPEGFAALADLDRRVLAAVRAAEPATPREQVAREAMIERLGLQLERYDAGDTTSDLNVIASGLQAVRQVFDLMPLAGEEAQRTVAARLAAVPDALSGLRRTLGEAAGDGRVAARRQVLACAQQCEQWNGADGDDFWAGLVERTGADGALRADLDRAAASAREATAAFGRFLSEELLPQAPAKDAVGEERYRRASRYFLGAEIDLAETYAWGWTELARIETEMAKVANQIAPGGTVDDAVAALDRDPARTIGDKEAFRDWMQELADSTIAALHGTHFNIPEQIRTIECCITPTSDGGIYYTGPSEDFSRPGRMWWAVPTGVTEFATWREVTTVYHEGVPGHHLQVGQTAVNSAQLNRWQRLLCWVSGHGEGWALYAERLMEDLGYLSDPGERLGMLDAQAFRAARVVVDIGMHLELTIPGGTGFHEGETWNPELGWQFLRAHCRMDDEFLRFELDRYLGWPGQAPSYKVGERIWLQAREDARRRKGAAFDLKDFHQQALDLGALGLDPLRQALERL